MTDTTLTVDLKLKARFDKIKEALGLNTNQLMEQIMNEHDVMNDCEWFHNKNNNEKNPDGKCEVTLSYPENEAVCHNAKWEKNCPIRLMEETDRQSFKKLWAKAHEWEPKYVEDYFPKRSDK